MPLGCGEVGDKITSGSLSVLCRVIILFAWPRKNNAKTHADAFLARSEEALIESLAEQASCRCCPLSGSLCSLGAFQGRGHQCAGRGVREEPWPVTAPAHRKVEDEALNFQPKQAQKQAEQSEKTQDGQRCPAGQDNRAAPANSSLTPAIAWTLTLKHN